MLFHVQAKVFAATAQQKEQQARKIKVFGGSSALYKHCRSTAESECWGHSKGCNLIIIGNIALTIITCSVFYDITSNCGCFIAIFRTRIYIMYIIL